MDFRSLFSTYLSLSLCQKLTPLPPSLHHVPLTFNRLIQCLCSCFSLIVWSCKLALQVSLLEENIKPKTDLPPLLVHLRDRRPEKLHYIGVSFGLTLDLFRFWRKQKFAPFYIGHIPVECC